MPWHTRKTRLSHGIHIQRVSLNPYKLLHNSEQVSCMLAVVLGKNGFLYFTAYTAPVERRFQGSGVTLMSLPRTDVFNPSPTYR